MDNSAYMAWEEGVIYEDIAIRWFKRKGFPIVRRQKTGGIDFIVERPLVPNPRKGTLDYERRGYEVKGRQLLYWSTTKSKSGIISVLRVTDGIKIWNLNLEGLTHFLFIIYDNFTDIFRIIELEKKEGFALYDSTKGSVPLGVLLKYAEKKVRIIKGTEVTVPTLFDVKTYPKRHRTMDFIGKLD